LPAGGGKYFFQANLPRNAFKETGCAVIPNSGSFQIPDAECPVVLSRRGLSILGKLRDKIRLENFLPCFRINLAHRMLFVSRISV
jgi:hypothetical protein